MLNISTIIRAFSLLCVTNNKYSAIGGLSGFVGDAPSFLRLIFFHFHTVFLGKNWLNNSLGLAVSGAGNPGSATVNVTVAFISVGFNNNA